MCVVQNVMPLLLSALVESRGLEPSAAGFFASATMAGGTVATAASALWIRRVASWPRATVASALFAVIAYLGLMVVDEYFMTLALAFAAGAANGNLHAPPTALLSDLDSPTRGFALMLGRSMRTKLHT